MPLEIESFAFLSLRPEFVKTSTTDQQEISTIVCRSCEVIDDGVSKTLFISLQETVLLDEYETPTSQREIIINIGDKGYAFGVEVFPDSNLLSGKFSESERQFITELEAEVRRILERSPEQKEVLFLSESIPTSAEELERILGEIYSRPV